MVECVIRKFLQILIEKGTITKWSHCFYGASVTSYVIRICGQLGPSPTRPLPTRPLALVDSAPALTNSAPHVWSIRPPHWSIRPLALVDSAPYKIRFGPLQKLILTLVKLYLDYCHNLFGLLQKSIVLCTKKAVHIYSFYTRCICM